MIKFWLLLLSVLLGCCPVQAAESPSPSPYSRWTNGPSTDPNFFPIAVWLQNPSRAEEYKRAGINTYVGLWRGPTEEQMAALRKTGMKLICGQNERSRKYLDDPTIIAWMHGDEPDNAQAIPGGKGWGPPIPPATIIADYQRIRTNDTTRPVFLNLGQGVAWDNYIGRGVRRNHPEDYPEYLKGSDIASFDIYPAVHDHKDIAGNLWYVAKGVERLSHWAGSERIVWNCLECTRIENPNRKPTPTEVRAEAWMALIHGSRGLVWFVHQFKPTFREAALLDDAEMLAAVTAVNRQITRLAPVLNTATLTNVVKVSSGKPEVPIATMLKKYNGATYLFAVCMRDIATSATFSDLPKNSTATVEDENRSIPVKDGAFTDQFTPWAVHIYRLETK
ncbi:MAG: hypothetical protein ACO1QS_00595 [Verrucomicrobiota bacterium]